MHTATRYSSTAGVQVSRYHQPRETTILEVDKHMTPKTSRKRRRLCCCCRCRTLPGTTESGLPHSLLALFAADALGIYGAAHPTQTACNVSLRNWDTCLRHSSIIQTTRNEQASTASTETEWITPLQLISMYQRVTQLGNKRHSRGDEEHAGQLKVQRGRPGVPPVVF